jgi:cyclophilin family peptidyl-prolyl cis-trans isomerase
VSKASKRERQRLNREARRAHEDKLAKRQRTMKTTRRVAIFAAPVLVVFIVLAITNSGGSGSSVPAGCQAVSTPPAKTAHLTAPTQGLSSGVTYLATIKTSCGTIGVTLDAKAYPKAVNNFVALTNQGFYDNLAFVRAAKDFVVQAGSPSQSNAGTNGGPGYTVQAETPTTQAGQSAYPVGTVAFAKAGTQPGGSAGSQFFIVTGQQGARLTPDYAVFGQVTSGLPVAQKIGSLAPSSGDGPLTKPVVIKSIRITTSATPPSS